MFMREFSWGRLIRRLFFWSGLIWGAVLMLAARAEPTLLRLVEAGLAQALAPELEQHEADLRQQGWTVETVPVDRRSARRPLAHVELATQVVWPRLTPDEDLYVFLIGECPMPYSGFAINPDGHAGTAGAYACTAYYATPSELWTDQLNNSGLNPNPRQRNLPGDGKFDQEMLPGVPQACVGFLDLSSLNPRSWGSEQLKPAFVLQKYRQWFALSHGYRHGRWAVRHLTANGSWTGRPAQGFSDWSWKEYGVEPRFFAGPWNPFGAATDAPFGIVSDFKALAVPASWWAERRGPWSVLYLYYGSRQIDFGTQQMTHPLGAGALATGSNGFGHWDLEDAAGRTLGEVWKRTLLSSPFSMPVNLYGDPTLVLPSR